MSAVLFVAIGFEFTARGSQGLVARGDFPAFYSAAQCVASGLGSRLYDQELQADLQQGAFSERAGNYLSFAYPPFVALALRPLAFFGPVAAKTLFMLFQLCCAISAIALLVRTVPRLKAYQFPLAVLFFWFGPLLTAIVGGQNVGFSLLILVAAAAALSRRTLIGDIVGGASIGVWLFKPSVSFLLVVALLFRPRPLVAVLSFLTVACLLLAAPVLFFGFEIWSSWAYAVQWFAEVDAQVNGHQMISIVGLISALAGDRGGAGLPTGYVASALLAGYALLRYRNAAYGEHGTETPGWLFRELLLLGSAAVLTSPHALYYELSLFLPAACVSVRLNSDRSVWYLLFLQMVVLVLCAFKDAFYFQPLAVLSALFLAVLYRQRI